MIEVVAALVKSGDRFLICRRPMHKARGGQWEFAGGKVEMGETMQQAIIREFREELDVELSAGDVIADVTYAYPDVTVHLSLLEAEIISGEICNKEHSEIRWITIREAHLYDFCPADREFVRVLLERAWMREQEIAHIHGWDFSHIDGRCTEIGNLPWDYRGEILRHLKAEHRLLDIDTGGGEFLLSLGHPHENTAAAEGYGPNVTLCREKLIPLGVDFRAADAGGELPFEDERFDIMINRHGSLNPGEIGRVLKKGGLFITQQVGAQNDREVVELLMPGTPVPYPDQYLRIIEGRFRDADFDVVRAEEAHLPMRFHDVGALVWLARIIEWEFPGFSVEKCLDRLYAAQDVLAEKGAIECSIHRFLLVARKK